MDRRSILARFVEVTGAEPGLAQDLLAGKQWNLVAAMEDYMQLTSNNAPASSRTTPQKPSATLQHTAQTAPIGHQPNQQEQAPQRKLGHQPLAPLPELQVVHPMTSSTVSNNSVGSLSSSSSSSAGRDTEDSSRPSSELKLFIPKAGEKDAPRSPGLNKKLQRGISRANCALVDFSRKKVTEDEHDHSHFLVDTPMYTFILPDLAMFPADFRAFMEKDLLEMATMANLEHAGRLNWWADCKACSRLWPMATTGDGNCLLHAASLGMWGFHDRQLTLRKALYLFLTENPHSQQMEKLKRRWRWQQTEVNKKSGLVYSEAEWEEEWKALLRLASAEPRTPLSGGTRSSLPTLSEEKPPTPTDLGEELTYESLEEFHVFVLAHILRRPIIIVSDTMLRDADGEAFAPISFGGIYLPLENPYRRDCEISPLVLTFDTAHFSALVPMEQDVVDYEGQEENQSSLPVVIPITDCDHKLLTVQFAVDPGPAWQWSSKPSSHAEKTYTLSASDKLRLLDKYMNLVKIPIKNKWGEDSSEQSSPRSSPRSSNGLKIASSSQIRQGSFGRKLKHFTKLEKSKNGSSSVGVRNSSGPVSLAELEDPSIIVGARLNERRHQLQDEMIKNYIDKAKERFEEECQSKTLQREEDRQRRENLTGSHQNTRVSPPANWNESYSNSREAYHSNPAPPTLSQNYPRQNQGYVNRQPSPEPIRRSNPQPTHLNSYQTPLTQTMSNPVPQSHRAQHPQYHPPVTNSTSFQVRPLGYQQGYQQGYQMDAPVESTVLVNKVNVKPQRQVPINRQQGFEERSGGMTRITQGIQQLQPTSVYQQSPPQQPDMLPLVARSAQVVSQQPYHSTTMASLSLQPTPTGSRSPQSPNSPQLPRSPQSPQRPLSAHVPQSSQAPSLLPPSKDSPKLAKKDAGKKSKGLFGTTGKSKSKGTRPCKNKGCDFYGTESTDYLCSQCYDVKKNLKSGRK
ncbi:OTU domain-containing protein 7A-like isoform X2 [Asterias rubens]|uniref:OTU domain-containing protein 7A-like isoform X2 n=1 Tax=Asterias rubens TaxID=7604 RepID=UPI001455D200|nr:OTU domain-containing protein 7A-like isoform X2 [Asterias rubens]